VLIEKKSKLNKIEKLKETRTPKEALEKLEEYSKSGYETILKEDLSFFLKSFGIFDRKEPNSFMMRVRVSGGRLLPHQAKKVGEVAKRFGKDYIDITTRMQIQLRYLKIEDIPTVISELESVGITSFQTGVDNVRNIVADPLSEVAKDSILSSDTTIQKMESIFLKKDEWISALPRKFNVGINGSFENRSNIFGHDFALVLAKKNGEYGYNLYLGGKVGEVAKQTDIFLKDDDEVLKVFEATLKIFRKYGFRDNRNRNRLHYLLEAVGIEKFSTTIRKEAKIELQTSGETLVSSEVSNETLVSLKNNEFAKLIIIPAGIFSGSELIELSNSGEIRFTYQQNLYVIGKERCFSKYSSYENSFYRNMVACAGSKDCPFGVIEGKPDAVDMAHYLSEKIVDFNENISFHWSACPKGCGIHGFGNFGYEGTKTKVDGKSVPAVHISVGGTMQSEGRRVLKSVPIPEAKLYTYDLVQIFLKMKKPFETFTNFEKRVLSYYSPEAINFLLKFNRKFTKLENIEFSQNPDSGRKELFEIFSFGVQIYKNISGENPYDEISNFSTTSEKAPAELESSISNTILKMVEKSFGDRYQLFSEILEDLKI
jgi:ferredoxin-nitrite reductase